ncbi:MAG: calcium/sodium antiporter [Burkholderiales bacterium]|nr:calcium/sodium antiporter [Burkholderiales bacterium]
MLTTAFLFLAGVALLIVGAEALVRGASRLALAWGISPLVVGLTVVAFGTSSPEVAVSVRAAASGRVDLAVGNVVGSNIFNVLFILGITALIAPLAVGRQVIRQEVPVMIGISLVLWLFAADGRVGRAEAAALLFGLVVYTVFLIRQSLAEARAERGNTDRAAGDAAPLPGRGTRTLVDIGLVLGGLALLVLGARWLVDAAVSVARELGVSELVIGLTVVAAGTSLPEVASSLVAAARGERDIAVGNVIGSNIFNILGCLGLAGLVAAEPLAVAPAVNAFDLPVMVAVAVACLPVFFTGAVVARWEGAMFLGYYAAYSAYLILAASAHDALPVFSGVMLGFVVPITVVTLVVLVIGASGAKRG